ncbi:MAG: DUF1015 family protein [candidate division WOR-3 bacterium]|nr:DUF1015 family protein [candidate division WOR-3 bacterium]
MSEVKPFKALRPKAEEVEYIESPPYDVLSREEARELAGDNPISFLHVVKAEIDLPEEVDIYDDSVYEKSKENLQRLTNQGHLIFESSPSFYLYTQEMGDHIQNGLVCLASVDGYDNNKIKKHEATRKAKEEDRTKHINTLNAQTGPVLLAYQDNDKTDEMHAIFNEIKESSPLYQFKSEDNVLHNVWRVNNGETIDRIQRTMSRAENLYIADGHHRSKAASLVRNLRRKNNSGYTGSEEYNYFLSVIFPHTELNIMAYNRVVKDLGTLSKNEFFDKILRSFILEEVEGQYRPGRPHHFGMFFDGNWFHLKSKEGSFHEADPVRSIDASILQENLLDPILSIKKPEESERIEFVGGIRGLSELEKLVNSGEFQVAFALYPTSMEELMRVADAGRNMPPKTTWFEPKLKSGLFIHLL